VDREETIDILPFVIASEIKNILNFRQNSYDRESGPIARPTTVENARQQATEV
jgi:hypothetical protein